MEERALPFREGEEVLVTIEEPHMYDEDDAVAKLDGYVISVAGAGSLIGEKRLVRIDSVSRSAATASLVGGPPPKLSDDGGPADGGRAAAGRTATTTTTATRRRVAGAAGAEDAAGGAAGPTAGRAGRGRGSD